VTFSKLSPAFVAAPPSGARIRARLRLSPQDEEIVRMVGEHLGRLAGQDLAVRCRLGRAGDVDLRADRKRALTPESSSRWAGAITRASNDQWERAHLNLLDARARLRHATRRVRARLAVPVGERQGRVRGYSSQEERFQKQSRLQHLQAELDQVEERLTQRRVSVCRGGRSLAKLRHHLERDPAAATPPVTEAERRAREALWRARWQAKRLFLTADGDASKVWGNQTIRVHADHHWLELRLPTSLAHLSNTLGRAATYRLSCPVVFNHRRDEWAGQAASGAVRYDILFEPGKRRWYVDASWRLLRVEPPSLEELRQHRTFSVDLNADHLAGWVIDPSGNQVSVPHTIPLDLDGQPASTRDGRLRAAVASVLGLAKANGCWSITVENLDFTDARRVGRETLGRGKRGKRFRRTVSGMPTRRFRALLVAMAANAGLWVIAVDPGWTSKWGQQYWKESLNSSTKSSIIVTRHHAAAVVIGRRGLGLGARRRPGVTRPHQRMGRGELPARLGRRALGCEGPGPPGGQWAAAELRKTRRAEWYGSGDQVVQDRLGPPWQDTPAHLLETVRW
jgi:hypothetical protein